MAVGAYAASSIFAFLLQPYAWTLPSDCAERGRLVIVLAPAAVSLPCTAQWILAQWIKQWEPVPSEQRGLLPWSPSHSTCSFPYKWRSFRTHSYRSNRGRLLGLNELANHECIQTDRIKRYISASLHNHSFRGIFVTGRHHNLFYATTGCNVDTIRRGQRTIGSATEKGLQKYIAQYKSHVLLRKVI